MTDTIQTTTTTTRRRGDDAYDTVPGETVSPPLRSPRVVVAPRRRWPGFLVVAALAAGVSALAVSSYYDHRSVGEKLDATVQNTKQVVHEQVQDLRSSAKAAVHDSAQVGDRAASAVADAGITAAVKTALAADPHLSAVKINVNTDRGVVSLEGPAPDDRSRERAEVLAAAPSGVVRVENRLVVKPQR